MSEATSYEARTIETEPFQQVAKLFGGSRVLHRRLNSQLDAHDLLLDGLPAAALSYFVENLVMLKGAGSLEKAIGMSIRTLQRHRDAPEKPLSQEHSGRTWKFAEILAKASTLFGSQEEAEQWLVRPAMGLDQRCPIDLLTTPSGVKLVEDFLVRLEYGVYA
ncbi:MAG TPA: antitoxin Xre/MbcA/ParS toxin-binding domain-containing protein [Stellaceae bacterium]|nr:antitoxin Xre/MbcA/ParS toxin-binding domain-containing protein [Stellaceae bacterium]